MIGYPDTRNGRRSNGISHQSPPECTVQLNTTVAARAHPCMRYASTQALLRGITFWRRNIDGHCDNEKGPGKTGAFARKEVFGSRWSTSGRLPDLQSPKRGKSPLRAEI
jgi:hypothetical protein